MSGTILDARLSGSPSNVPAPDHDASSAVRFRENSLVSGRSANRIKQIIEQLFAGIAQRVDGELGLAARIKDETAAQDQRFQAASAERTNRYQTERDGIQADYDRVCAEAGMQYQAHYSAASEEYDVALRGANQDFNEVSEQARSEFDETRWMVVSYFDENAGGSPKQRFEQFEQNLENTTAHVDQVVDQLSQTEAAAIKVLKKRRMWVEPEPVKPEKPTGDPEELLEKFQSLVDEANSTLVQIRKRALPILFAGPVPFVVSLLAAGCLAGLANATVDTSWLGFQTAPPQHEWLAILGGAASMLVLTVQFSLFFVARGVADSDYSRLASAIVNSRTVLDHWRKVSSRGLKKQKEEFDSWYRSLVDERDSRLAKSQKKFDRLMADAEAKRNAELQEAKQRYPALLESITRERDVKLQAAHDDFPGRLEKLESRFQWDVKKLAEEHESSLATIQQQFEFDWQNMARTWHSVVDGVGTSSGRLVADAASLSQRWTDLAFGNWSPGEKIPTGIRLGKFALRLDDIEYGLPEDDRLIPEQQECALPALVAFPEEASLYIRASGTQGRSEAVKLLQVAMLRLLATLPPGKVRFTILDPVGLGENFSAFMHLADYDELMVTSRIWSEATHIEQRLTDLTGHMETVFQTYLRNEFKTIEEYNEYAGEVAEPYHILVVAGFPANFTEQAGRRLTSIVSSGPKCGIYTLMSADPQLTVPTNFQLSDVEENATCLTWSDGQFQFDDPDIAWLPFTVEEPPEPDEFSRIVKRIGDESKDARRVEVSFDRVAPRELWQNDSRAGVDIPLGRAGATKLQHMRLGRGTSQHVLVAGKTGSGKSTLMHILVTNLALHYSPDEVQFYLIDFKKGVEFKTYAANGLPHARVIAIESDREFGLSVLQRLDGILKERGDLFRDQGVQDIASYRNENPSVAMPRLLLLIDEFQEFFTEDDRISQTASLMLDRLVRQGRAFGIHVLLGSQTLGGAYSLARSTLGQVAVRIALQCSESDAHLILSEENTAARLLTRPGEAIYNDANGLLEGNHPFQIAWLEDEKRDSCLQRIAALTAERNLVMSPPIVFEGNVPASPLNNQELCGIFENEPAGIPRVITAWLGEAVAIKPHTEIRFRRISGSNLLMIGQSPLAARGILSTVLCAAAAQTPPQMSFEANGLLVEDDSLDEPSLPTESPSVDGEGASAAVSASPSHALEAMKSFSFADMQIENPINDDADKSDTHDESPETAEAARFYILDGSLVDDPDELFWQDLTDRLPHQVQVGGPQQAGQFVREIAAEIRQRGSSDDAPPVFFLIDNIGRFRDLRKDDDDFGFGGDRNRSTTPAKLFVEILRNGPAVGVHTAIWADTFNNAGRWMSNQTMRELEIRVAFQMSATDSSNFIDSPIAGKLGQNRALLYLEEVGTHEKFRPYGLPSEEWLQIVSRQFAGSREVEKEEDGDPPAEVVDDLSEWTVL